MNKKTIKCKIIIVYQMIVALMVKYLHEDINVRLGKFENELKMRVKSRDVLKTASVELNLFFVLLDEGLLSSDAILASALWSLVYSINSCMYHCYNIYCNSSLALC